MFKKIFSLILLLPCFAFAEDIKTYDVLIVGGGVGGTYAGYRLSDAQDKTICLMELNNRIGGRLFSVTLPEMPNTVAEVGGMRFLEKQANVWGLIKHLGFTPQFFDHDSTENYIYVRRVRLTPKDYTQSPEKIPYNLTEEERGKSSRQLMLSGLYKVFPEIKNMTHSQISEYMKEKSYNGVPIWETGYWNFFLEVLSIEGYNFIRDVGGYYSGISDWNAYDAILSYSKYNQDVTFYKLKEGFDAIPKKLAELFVKQGGQLRLNTQVTKILLVEENGEKLFQIFYQSMPEEAREYCYAKHLILALPKRSIELLDADSFIFSNEELMRDIQRVDSVLASKVFLWYDKAWWTDLGLEYGPSRTDLPLRQCYYFGTEGEKGLLMGGYNDGIAVGFWEGYFPKSAFNHRIKDRFTHLDEFLKIHALPKTMLSQLTKQLSEIHGIDVPSPTSALFQDWSDDPFGGGWHVWNPHNQSWKVIPHMRHPIKDVNLYICGEAYSDSQGWVEGAVNTTELMLQEYFNLPRAKWIPSDYSLGN